MTEPAVQTQWIEIAGAGAGYLALPPPQGGQRSGPGLLLWQEIFGVNEHIRTLARQYALDGFAVLAPDLFWRQAPRIELGYEGADRDRATALMQAYAADAADADADIAAAVAALRARAEVGHARIGSIGWCYGGQMAYLTAAAGGADGLSAAVAYYGGGIQNRLDRAGRVACPLLLHYAGNDSHIPPQAVEQVRQALPQAELHVHPNAQHGFNCWARSAWHAPSATLAHGRTLAFLARHLHGA